MSARWPNLFLLGAPKAATTSLHRYLDQHPQISMSDPKEPHFFTRTWDELGDDPDALAEAETAYKQLFADASEPVVGESSPGYLWRPEVPERIHQRVEEPKLLACLRDPVQRAYSDYLMGIRHGTLDAPFPEVIETEREHGWREAVDPLIERGRYGTQLERYADTFGLENLHVVLLDDLKQDALGTLESIARFLDVDVDAMQEVDYETVHNPFGVPKNALASHVLNAEPLKRLARLIVPEKLRIYVGEHLLLDKPDKPPMDPEAKRMLAEIYEPEIRKAEELLDRQLPELRESWPQEAEHG